MPIAGVSLSSAHQTVITAAAPAPANTQNGACQPKRPMSHPAAGAPSNKRATR